MLIIPLNIFLVSCYLQNMCTRRRHSNGQNIVRTCHFLPSYFTANRLFLMTILICTLLLVSLTSRTINLHSLISQKFKCDEQRMQFLEKKKLRNDGHHVPPNATLTMNSLLHQQPVALGYRSQNALQILETNICKLLRGF